MQGDFYYCQDCELAYEDGWAVDDHADFCGATVKRIDPDEIDLSIVDYVKLVNE